jgi:hypothetical protein
MQTGLAGKVDDDGRYSVLRILPLEDVISDVDADEQPCVKRYRG